MTGLDRLLADPTRLAALAGQRVGLLVNPTSVTASLEHAIDALQRCGVKIARLFGPEHGVRADAQDMEVVTETVDSISGVAVISLYGATLESLTPSQAHLDGLDVVICDIQDIGARYYTYVYTIGLMMKACGQAGIKVIVLDRPNPITGLHVEGNVVLPEFASFVGMQPLATRHAMTCGELAHFFVRFGGWPCELEVIAMRGWRRAMWFDQTGLPWVMPSPNMPTLETATVYVGQCLLEGTNASEGRGTTRPFELFGAPYVDAVALQQFLVALDLPGVAWRLAAFRPGFQKHAQTTCRGLQMHVTERDQFDSLATGYAVLAGLLKVCPGDFAWREEAYEFVADRLAIDLLLGDEQVRHALEAGEHPVALSRRPSAARTQFDQRRQECLLYEQ
ncbi:MAG: DUF1343 domain-containing protein [Bradymonadaceae bacterium]|nr:DUF1343 domain-containing protein [Lujinxingiaceae bacterium]